MLKLTATKLAARRGIRGSAARRACAGFTIVELMISFLVLMTICAMAVPALADAIQAARVARAVADLRTIGDAAYGYLIETGAAPTSLTDIEYDKQVDPWEHGYVYVGFTPTTPDSSKRVDRWITPINKYFDLSSMGPDGATSLSLSDAVSQDDIVWANDGVYIGPATNY